MVCATWLTDVADVKATVAAARELGYDLVGEVADFQDLFRLACVRGPEGLILELTEDLNATPADSQSPPMSGLIGAILRAGDGNPRLARTKMQNILSCRSGRCPYPVADQLKGLIPVVPSAAKIAIAPSAAPSPSLSTSKRPANSFTCPSAHSTGMSAARSFTAGASIARWNPAQWRARSASGTMRSRL
jgi:hypothetical protein